MKELKEDIKITAFPRAGSQERDYRRMLDTYKFSSPRIQYTLIDPDRFPALARQNRITFYGQMVLERKDRRIVVDDSSEESITNGLVKVTQTTKKVVYFLGGHGEPSTDGSDDNAIADARRAVEGKGFDAKPLLLVQTGEVPKDANLVVVPGPKRDFVDAEKKVLREYYQKGGAVIVMLDPDAPDPLKKWAQETFQVTFTGGVIIDPLSRLLGGDLRVPIVAEYASHPITKDFNLATAYPLAQGVEFKDPKGVLITPIVKSSQASFLKVDPQAAATAGQPPKFEEGKDKKGPIDIAVSVEPSRAAEAEGQKPPKGRAVLIGDSEFIRNAFLTFPGNRDMFTNMVAWALEEGTLVSIGPKGAFNQPFVITGGEGQTLFWVSVILVPLGTLLLGGSLYMRRRYL